MGLSVHKAKALATILTKRSPSTQVREWTDFDDACNDLLAIASAPAHQDLLGGCAETGEEAKQWLTFAKTFHDGDSSDKLKSVNDHLLKRSVLAGPGTAVSLVDITVFVAVRDAVINLNFAHLEHYPNLVRWFDYIQNEENVVTFFNKIPIKKTKFEQQEFLDDLTKKPAKAAPTQTTVDNQASAKSEALTTESNGVEQLTTKKKVDAATTSATITDKKLGSDQVKNVKTKDEKIAEQKKEVDISVSALDIRIGLVRKVWKHPSADSLLVEEIDLGDGGVRQVVSGLAKYLKEEEMLNRRIVMIANVKPGKLRDVLSAGLVLCASNSDHSTVEPLMPPDTAAVGERVTFAGHEGQPEEVLNPKKKQLEKILPGLFTDENGVATYQGIPFMTRAGPCKSTLAKAAIK